MGETQGALRIATADGEVLGEIEGALGDVEASARTEGEATWAFQYDLAGRLVAATLDGAPYSSYIYDANGNRLSYDGPFGAATGSYDDQDRLLAYGGATYAYTANGELATKTQNAQSATYSYDALGNLRAVTLPDGIEIRYVVDGLGRRIGKKIDGLLVQGFLYRDTLNPIAELDGTGAVVSRFVYPSRRHVPDYLLRDGTAYRLLSDHLGSVRLVVDTATGAVAQRLNYDEYGRVTLDTNPGFQPFGFAGGLYDHQTGLLRFGARDYDPTIGRWTAKDPQRLGPDTNVYAYAL